MGCAGRKKTGVLAFGGGSLEMILSACPLLLVSGVQHIMEEEGFVVPETHLDSMGDIRRKKVDVEQLLVVEKEVGITFTLADARVVDKLVVSKEVDVKNRRIR